MPTRRGMSHTSRKKVNSEENDCVDMHRYGDNLYEQSPSHLFSVFG